MGLDTSHDCFHGAYSAFGRWRLEVAKAGGYHTCLVKDEDGVHRDAIMIDWGHLPEGHLPEGYLYGIWTETPEDPLIVLIAHSDCEGEIFPKQAAPLADRLEGLLPILAALDEGGGHIAARGGWVGVTEKFIAGLRQAAVAGEPVGFY